MRAPRNTAPTEAEHPVVLSAQELGTRSDRGQHQRLSVGRLPDAGHETEITRGLVRVGEALHVGERRLERIRNRIVHSRHRHQQLHILVVVRFLSNVHVDGDGLACQRIEQA
jgi:hypothetical protein